MLDGFIDAPGATAVVAKGIKKERKKKNVKHVFPYDSVDKTIVHVLHLVLLKNSNDRDTRGLERLVACSSEIPSAKRRPQFLPSPPRFPNKSDRVLLAVYLLFFASNTVLSRDPRITIIRLFVQ